MGRNLSKLALTGALAIYSGGCSYQLSEYHFDGKIEGDRVEFKEVINSPADNERRLIVRKSNGKIIEYIDNREEDLKLDVVEITMGGRLDKYRINGNAIEKEVLKEAQIQFDAYLRQIKEINRNYALEGIKNSVYPVESLPK